MIKMAGKTKGVNRLGAQRGRILAQILALFLVLISPLISIQKISNSL